MTATYVAKHVERCIATGQLGPGQRLPAAASVARQLGVSAITVRKALRQLREAGRVVMAEDGTLVVAGRAGSAEVAGSPELQARQTSAEALADTLREDVLTGGADRALPSAKELCARLKCSHHTLRAALRALVKKGTIIRQGSRYVAAAPGMRRAGRSAVYFVGEPSLLESATVQTFVMGMERELEALRWGQLRFLVADSPAQCGIPEDHRVAAYVHFRGESPSPWWDFAHRPSSIPTVVVTLHEVAAQERKAPPNLVMIAPDNRRAGCEVGAHLAAGGHTRCAYLSDLSLAEGCAMLRLQGLAEVFRLTPGRSGRTCRVFDASAVRTDTRLRTGALNEDISRVVDAAVHSSGLSETFVRREFRSAFGVLHWWNRYAALQPVFEEAFSDRSITAWVCAHDALAMLVHTFLAGKGAVPGRDIALASFDNSPLAYTLGITSYDFAFDRIGRTAAQCLAAPHLTLRDRSGRVHVPGLLVARASTAGRNVPAP